MVKKKLVRTIDGCAFDEVRDEMTHDELISIKDFQKAMKEMHGMGYSTTELNTMPVYGGRNICGSMAFLSTPQGPNSIYKLFGVDVAREGITSLSFEQTYGVDEISEDEGFPRPKCYNEKEIV